MAIASYQISSNKAITRNYQPLATDKQANRYEVGVSQQEGKQIYVWKFKYANNKSWSTVVCISNGLICGNISCLAKRSVTSHVKWNSPQSIGILWILSCILHSYMANNWWLHTFVAMPSIIPNLGYVYMYRSSCIMKNHYVTWLYTIN